MVESSFKSRCDKIIRKIIKKYDLPRNSVLIEVRNLDRFSMLAKRVSGGKYKVIIDYSKYDDTSDKEIAGALAHELVHFEYYQKWSYFRYLLEYFLYKVSEAHMAKIEKSIDIETIKKGFGKELAANRKYRYNKADKKEKILLEKFYMGPKEIKEKMSELKLI